MPNCGVCKIELYDKNWYPSLQKNKHYICKSCADKYNRKYNETHRESRRESFKKYYKKHTDYVIMKVLEWQKKNPDKRSRNSKEYMRNYMKGYRQRNLERMRELGRLEQYRRVRKFSTDNILNEYFNGADLHHITPSTAIYIPKKLHRSIFHNLEKDIGMKEINGKVIVWLNDFEQYNKRLK